MTRVDVRHHPGSRLYLFSGQNSAGFPQICATSQRDTLRRHFRVRVLSLVSAESAAGEPLIIGVGIKSAASTQTPLETSTIDSRRRQKSQPGQAGRKPTKREQFEITSTKLAKATSHIEDCQSNRCRCAHVDPTSASYSNPSSSSIIRSITPSPPCQNAGSRASRPKGASSSEWCLVPPAASISR
jgi:hypothetical protein